MKKLLFLLISVFMVVVLKAQHTDANIFGDVQSNGEHVPFITIFVEGMNIGTHTDVTGHFMLIDLPEGTHIIVAQGVGYKTKKDTVELKAGNSIELNFVLEEEIMTLNEVVVTGTKTFKRITNSPVIVNVIDAKTLGDVQACNLSEGLRFQTGLRVETDCQTCNYTQLRMNGLGGGYSQILINGRPVFSPLTGLYGMEQIPANMIDQIEVVRGGGSALYGSSAIGGTVNIITKIPSEDGYDLNFTGYNINGRSLDNVLNGNVNMVSRNGNAGATIFVSRRTREAYDHNDDNFSELPSLKNNSFGASIFYQPKNNQKLELNFSSLNEYRYGGEMINGPAHLAKQSEERTHNVFMGGLDYQINFNNDNSSFIFYAAGQYTDRNHYTGIYPDSLPVINEHLSSPPYGYTVNSTMQAGSQLNHSLTDFFGGSNVLSVGFEYVFDDVFDSIPAYLYEIDQQTSNFAGFLQSDYEINKNINVLAGLRADKHNLLDKIILSPRFSVLYKLKSTTQFRLTWGTGFRAPQAFDADMHIAFAGGGISRISLAPELKEERSQGWSASVNYDKATKKFIAGFTFEGFYTHLKNAFYLKPVGEDNLGELFKKSNGDGAIVKGLTMEVRANYNRKLQVEAGYTFQKSLFDKAVENIEGLEARREFLRTPDQYGFATLSIMHSKKWNGSISGTYTGPMLLTHYAGAPEQTEDVYIESPSFWDINLKLSYSFVFAPTHSGFEVFGGVKNILNAYQNDFDTGRNRDSGYIYGPAVPRTFFLGIRLRSLK